MPDSSSPSPAPDYGLDAPGAVRNLFIAAGAGLLTRLTVSAIHNVYSAPGRAAALAEIARVLKPGGTVLIEDIRHIREYAAALRAGGCTDVRNASSDFGTILLRIITIGAVWPGILIARKDGRPAVEGA